ncbi:hypothetical protein C482_05231 [Natrialba chahannaoensis JCM 10990]|uniref:Uncharacterized protein n=1 Tax=Natrialba chahannaoensis JCM 10990 TaxID=1227492 RepID=M0AXN6_9EURY|nr:hypothetical protein C482_05231 [Natrialba chahannaoensis JCM 10990]
MDRESGGAVPTGPRIGPRPTAERWRADLDDAQEGPDLEIDTGPQLNRKTDEVAARLQSGEEFGFDGPEGSGTTGAHVTLRVAVESSLENVRETDGLDRVC